MLRLQLLHPMAEVRELFVCYVAWETRNKSFVSSLSIVSDAISYLRCLLGRSSPQWASLSSVSRLLQNSGSWRASWRPQRACNRSTEWAVRKKRLEPTTKHLCNGNLRWTLSAWRSRCCWATPVRWFAVGAARRSRLTASASWGWERCWASGPCRRLALTLASSGSC